VAILNANYLAHRLAPHYRVLYTGSNGLVAHECIIDVRSITRDTGVSVDDVAKRLIDYGFHAPTMSFPVAGTLMIEPTESEDLPELDRFVDAMIAIRSEIDRVASGEWPADDNPLVHAPHTAEDATADEWPHVYSRELAGVPSREFAACESTGLPWVASTACTATATSSAAARRSRRISSSRELSRVRPASGRAAVGTDEAVREQPPVAIGCEPVAVAAPVSRLRRRSSR